MRVAIEATPLTLTSGGLARYTRELAAALAEVFTEDRYLLVSDQPFSGPVLTNLTCRPGPRRGLARRWWTWGLPLELARTGAEVFHGPDFSVPYLPVRPSVMTVHDLSPWLDAGWQSREGRVRRRTPLLLQLGLATMILTDSAVVRAQVTEFFRVPATRVVAVPLAAHLRFRPVPRPESERAYFLFAGTLEPRKNLAMLIEAWRPLRDRVNLVLAGRQRADSPRISPEPGLRLLGEVPDEDLPGLYSGALAFVYPSLYEGFGLPVLEAMQCGACVLTSRDPAIAEVAGDAALRLDARDRRAWTEALLACASGGDFVERLREKAVRRASEFSWTRTARLTRDVYVEAMQRFQR